MIPTGLSMTSGLAYFREITSLLGCTTCEDLKLMPILLGSPPTHTHKFTGSQMPRLRLIYMYARGYLGSCMCVCPMGTATALNFLIHSHSHHLQPSRFYHVLLPTDHYRTMSYLGFAHDSTSIWFPGSPQVLHFPRDVLVLCSLCLHQFSWMTKYSLAFTRQYSLFIR